MTPHLRLKWGTLKGWSLGDGNDHLLPLIAQFCEDAPDGCMSDRPDAARRNLLCQIIDEFNGEIKNDWSGEMLSKEQAKKYIMEYR